ncbi:MAG TPA: PorP/SprF family type IX secretion system membrane protein [Ohtaekwangia sp.]|nr:PorP/SprF family type IX secretion system membrane protein [Ohtaekwangia sp.]
MRYFFYFTIGILLCERPAFGQNYPVYNSFYVNPYIYNPAEAATEFTYVYITHRRQWLGIEGAPVLTTATFNTLLHDTRAGIGGRLTQYKRGLLTTTDITGTYAYGIPVTQKNWLFFGLSGGLISNTIDLTKISDPDDPVIADYLANNLQPVANFGMLLRMQSGLNFGVSLPQLFSPGFNGESHFSNTAVSPFDNIFITAYYRRKIEGKIVSRKKGGMRSRVRTKERIAPLEFYVNYKYAALGNSQLEVLGKFNLTESFWLGASYRVGYGLTGNFGINVQRFTFGYSYEPNSQPEDGFSQGTHEVILGLRLGDQKRFKRTAPTLRSQLKTPPTQTHTARFQENVEDPDNIAHQSTSKKKYYVVIRAFADFTQADNFKKRLIEQEYNANIFYYEKDRKYYVHVLETEKQGDANEEVKNLKNYTKLREARVLTVILTEKGK